MRNLSPTSSLELDVYETPSDDAIKETSFASSLGREKDSESFARKGMALQIRLRTCSAFRMLSDLSRNLRCCFRAKKIVDGNPLDAAKPDI
jgi:hypothetical protein